MNQTTPGGSDLQGPALGLGSTYGYSGADLTNLRTAIARDEVVWQPENTTEPRTLELRIHGVGGAPPEVNLESPATLQVAGDARAGFYRAWFPGGTARGRPLQEAYCWGHLDTAWWTALWLLLLPFGLLNVAHWALPPVGPSPVRAIARALLRLQSLLLTVALVATTCYIALDLVAWQAAERDLLWSWTGGFENWQLRHPDGADVVGRVRGDRRPVVAQPPHPGRLRGPQLRRRCTRPRHLAPVRPDALVRGPAGEAAARRPPARRLRDRAADPRAAALRDPCLGPAGRVGGRRRGGRRGDRPDPLGLDRPWRRPSPDRPAAAPRPGRGGRFAGRPGLHAAWCRWAVSGGSPTRRTPPLCPTTAASSSCCSSAGSCWPASSRSSCWPMRPGSSVMSSCVV